MSEVVRQFTVGHDDEGARLDRWFKRHLPDVGFATVSRWARTGQIRVDGKRADVDTRLVAGQILRVPPGSAIVPTSRGQRVRKILTEEETALAEGMLMTSDRAAIVINKPPGLATQGGSGIHAHVDGLLDAYVGENEPRPRLVHRLDKDTSGVLLVARTPGSAAYFSRHFAGRSARKIYWALVMDIPSINEGFIDLPIAKQPGTGGEKMMVDESGQGQTARTRYRVIDRAGNRAAWVELQPLTGRTHQLRVHMAAIGHPIVGDGKYGGQAAFLTGTISRKLHLHARRLIIPHPEGDTLDVTAPLPDHFAASIAQLGFTESEGDFELDAGPRLDERVAEKRAGRAHAKQYRKERRGERRKRSEGETARRPTGQRASGKPDGKPVERSGKPVGKPAGKFGARPSAGKPVDRPGGKPVGKFAGKPAERGAARAGAKPGGKPAGKTGERSFGKPPARSGDKSAGRPVGKPVGRSIGKPAARRPAPPRGPRA